MAQCVTLALLLHILLVVLVGTVPGGSAPPGQGVWGALNITLRGIRSEAGSGEPRPAAPSTGPIGTARQERFGGAVRPDEPRPAVPDSPGAARQGSWRSTPAEELLGPVEQHTGNPTISTPAEAPVAVPPLRSEPMPAPHIELPAPRPVEISPKDLIEAAPAIRPALPPPPPIPVPPPEPTPEPLPQLAAPVPRAPVPLGLKPGDVPNATMPPSDRLSMPNIEPIKPATPPRPAPPPIPAPAPTPAPVPPPPAPRALPAALPSPVPAPPQPAPIPQPLPAAPIRRTEPVEALAPPKLPPPIEPPVPAPVNTPEVAPAPALAPTPAAAPAPAPETVQRPAPEPLRPAAPDRSAAPTPAASPAPTPAPAAMPTNSAAPAPLGSGQPAAEANLPRPGVGAPDAGSRVGLDVATPPSVPPSAPRLNLDLAPSRGGAISGQGPRGVFQMMPRPPETKSKLTEGIEKAAKPDCRQAYGGMGLAAVVPLVIDAVRDKGCKW